MENTITGQTQLSLIELLRLHHPTCSQAHPELRCSYEDSVGQKANIFISFAYGASFIEVNLVDSFSPSLLSPLPSPLHLSPLESAKTLRIFPSQLVEGLEEYFRDHPDIDPERTYLWVDMVVNDQWYSPLSSLLSPLSLFSSQLPHE